MSTTPTSATGAPHLRRRLEVQGFDGLDDAALYAIEPWLRFTPAVCTALVIVGTALALPEVLWALVPLAFLGAVFPRHPFDYVYNAGLRRLTGTAPLPPSGPPRRFACGMASAWIGLTAAMFTAGIDPAGYALGGILAAVGSLVSVTHICIPSMVYRLLTGTLRVQPA